MTKNTNDEKYKCQKYKCQIYHSNENTNLAYNALLCTQTTRLVIILHHGAIRRIAYNLQFLIVQRSWTASLPHRILSLWGNKYRSAARVAGDGISLLLMPNGASLGCQIMTKISLSAQEGSCKSNNRFQRKARMTPKTRHRKPSYFLLMEIVDNHDQQQSKHISRQSILFFRQLYF